MKWLLILIMSHGGMTQITMVDEPSCKLDGEVILSNYGATTGDLNNSLSYSCVEVPE